MEKKDEVGEESAWPTKRGGGNNNSEKGPAEHYAKESGEGGGAAKGRREGRGGKVPVEKTWEKATRKKKGGIKSH